MVRVQVCWFAHLRAKKTAPIVRVNVGCAILLHLGEGRVMNLPSSIPLSCARVHFTLGRGHLFRGKMPVISMRVSGSFCFSELEEKPAVNAFLWVCLSLSLGVCLPKVWLDYLEFSVFLYVAVTHIVYSRLQHSGHTHLGPQS